MSQKVNARDAFLQLNDRIVKQKNYITFLQQQLDEKNIEYKKILDQNVELKQQLDEKNIEYKEILYQNVELKQKLQLETSNKKENRLIHLQKEENEENEKENEVIYVKEPEQVKNGISFKITEINNEPTQNVNKKSKMNINFNDLGSLKGLTLGDLMRN